MFIVKYNRRVYLPDYKAYDVPETKKFHRVFFSGGLLYGYRTEFSIETLSHDEIVSIDDTDNPGAYIDVDASFKAQELAYEMPF